MDADGSDVELSDGPVSSNLNFWSGTNFFIMQRVPQRDHLVKLVKSKKGVIVPLERQADIIIADDLRARFAPSGALSWKYIIESVDAGRKKSRTLYMINGSEKALGPAQSKAGTSAKKKADTPKGPKRVAYTEEDDRALRLHVARRVIKGEAPLGNSLYMDFFEINDRHPWQSWRSRWIDRFRSDLDDLPRVLAALSPTRAAPAERRSQPMQPASQTGSVYDFNPPVPPRSVSRKRLPDSQLTPKKAAEPQSHYKNAAPESRSTRQADSQRQLSKKAVTQNQSKKVAESQSRPLKAVNSASQSQQPRDFDAKDDEILWSSFEAIRLAIRNGDWDFWNKFARKHPQHSAKLWSAYYSDAWKPYILPLKRRQKAKEEAAQMLPMSADLHKVRKEQFKLKQAGLSRTTRKFEFVQSEKDDSDGGGDPRLAPSPAPFKVGRGRPLKVQEESENEDGNAGFVPPPSPPPQARRRRGGSHIILSSSEESENDSDGAEELVSAPSPAARSSAKRGRGRPRYAESLSSEESERDSDEVEKFVAATSSSPAGRGERRTRHSPTSFPELSEDDGVREVEVVIPAPSLAPQLPAKRGPGRPRKYPINSAPGSAPAKRGPGRPRKYPNPLSDYLDEKSREDVINDFPATEPDDEIIYDHDDEQVDDPSPTPQVQTSAKRGRVRPGKSEPPPLDSDNDVVGDVVNPQSILSPPNRTPKRSRNNVWTKVTTSAKIKVERDEDEEEEDEEEEDEEEEDEEEEDEEEEDIAEPPATAPPAVSVPRKLYNPANHTLSKGEAAFLLDFQTFSAHHSIKFPGDGVGLLVARHYIRWSALQLAVAQYLGFDAVCENDSWNDIAKELVVPGTVGRLRGKDVARVYERYLADYDDFVEQRLEVLRRLEEEKVGKSNGKRSLQQGDGSGRIDKRRRVEDDAEIPATPEHKLQPAWRAVNHQ